MCQRTLEQKSHSQYHTFSIDPHKANSESHLPCIFAYQGTAYKALDSKSLTVEQLSHLEKSLRILSGLYGILHPYNYIQPYRLDMGTKTASLEGMPKNLYEYWGNQIQEHVCGEETTSSKTSSKTAEKVFILNCASQEYAKAMNLKSLEGNVTYKDCVFMVNGKKAASYHAKYARGLMVRFVATNLCKTVEDVKKFDLEGYSFVSETDSTLTFNKSKTSQTSSQPPKKRKKKA